jgi:16S rRNA (guanine527-N7)-methyltransferase
VEKILLSYFPSLPASALEKLSALQGIYLRWNSMINVISRKDMDNFVIHHLLHSLAIAKIISFVPGTRVLDVGTGGGFPGIPLAIMFPDVSFTLLDSIEKKIKVVSSVATELDLKNVVTSRKRVEEEKERFDFVVSRAVTEFAGFAAMTMKNIDSKDQNNLNNGIIYLKGGDVSADQETFGERLTVWNISDFFAAPFFETKKILHLRS